jgi:hypothetical protein
VFGTRMLLVLGQACWIVLRRGRSALGSSTMTERIVAFEVAGLVMVSSRLAPLPRSLRAGNSDSPVSSSPHTNRPQSPAHWYGLYEPFRLWITVYKEL